MVWAGQHWHGGPRSAKWASTSRANAAIPSRACRATPKLLEARSAADFRVENGLHWVLDLAFQEDASRMHKDHSQQNFVVFRHMALNLLKQEPTAKCGIKARRLKAGWSEEYLRQVLAA